MGRMDLSSGERIRERDEQNALCVKGANLARSECCVERFVFAIIHPLTSCMNWTVCKIPNIARLQLGYG